MAFMAGSLQQERLWDRVYGTAYDRFDREGVPAHP